MNKRLIILSLLLIAILTHTYIARKDIAEFYKKDHSITFTEPPKAKPGIFDNTPIGDFLLKVDKLSPMPNRYPGNLTKNERKLFKKIIKGAKSYLEFGAGDSTYLALLNTKAKVTSVEIDDDVMDTMREWKYIKDKEGKRLNFIHANIGEIIESDFIPEDKNKHLYPDYSKNMFKDGCNYDVVYINGNFRAACALQAILNCPKDTKIIIHDFASTLYYHEILEFMDISKEADTMTLLKRKNKIDKKRVEAVYEKFKYDWK